MLAQLKKIPWRFLPLGCLFLVLPFIVRLTYFKLDPDSVSVMMNTTHKDWFFYYKSLAFIFITVWMLITILIIGRHMTIDRQLPFNIYYISGGLFILMTILSTYLSDYVNASIVGGPTRFEGLGVIICYVMVMFYTMILMDDPKYFKWVVVCFGILVIAQTIIGFFQYIGYDPLHWIGIRELVAPGDFAQNYYFADGKEPWFLRTDAGFMQGTLGNRNYSGSFAALSVPFFVALAVLCKGKKIKLTMIGISICTLFISFASRSRAGMMGINLSFVIGLVLLCPTYPHLWRRFKLYFETNSRRATLLSLLTLIVILGCGALYASNEQAKRLFADISTLFGSVPDTISTSDATTPYPVDFKFDKNRISIVTEFDHTLHITLSKDTPVFTDEDNRVVSTLIPDTEEGTRYEIRPTSFAGYSFEHWIDQAQNTDYMRFYRGDNVFLGFEFKADGTTQLVNPYSLEPINLSSAPSIGFEGKEALGSYRGYIWSRSFPMLTETLLLGYGPDTYMLKFPQHDDFLGRLKSRFSLFICVDKPHNTYLQIWLNQGFVALLAFLVIVGTYMLHSIKLYGFKKEYQRHEALGIALLLAITGYLGASFFNDTTLSVTPLFWALLGVGIAYNRLYKKLV